MALDKRHLLFGMVSLTTIVILFLVRPISLTPNVKAVLSKQKGNIQTIDTTRDISSTKTFYFDTIEFENSSSLIHKQMGPLGFSDDFFIDFEANIDVRQEGDYIFTVRSDDGFRLFVDDRRLSEWLGDRPVAATEGSTFLTQGRHQIKLSYFQGYGNLGLSANYRKVGGPSFPIGQSSVYLTFAAFPK